MKQHHAKIKCISLHRDASISMICSCIHACSKASKSRCMQRRRLPFWCPLSAQRGPCRPRGFRGRQQGTLWQRTLLGSAWTCIGWDRMTASAWAASSTSASSSSMCAATADSGQMLRFRNTNPKAGGTVEQHEQLAAGYCNPKIGDGQELPHCRRYPSLAASRKSQ